MSFDHVGLLGGLKLRLSVSLSRRSSQQVATDQSGDSHRIPKIAHSKIEAHLSSDFPVAGATTAACAAASRSAETTKASAEPKALTKERRRQVAVRRLQIDVVE